MRDPKVLSSRGPSLSASVDQQRLGLGQQVLAEILWAVPPTPRRSPGPGPGSPQPAASAAATWVQRWSRAAASLASARTRPGASRVAVASQAAVDRSPVASATSSAMASTRSCSAWARAITRDSPTNSSCFSPVVAELRADRSQVVQPTLDPSQGLGVGGGHGTSQPSTTDSGSGLRTPYPQGVPRNVAGFRDGPDGPPQPADTLALLAPQPTTVVAGSRDGPDGPPQPAGSDAAPLT